MPIRRRCSPQFPAAACRLRCSQSDPDHLVDDDVLIPMRSVALLLPGRRSRLRGAARTGRYPPSMAPGDVIVTDVMDGNRVGEIGRPGFARPLAPRYRQSRKPVTLASTGANEVASSSLVGAKRRVWRNRRLETQPRESAGWAGPTLWAPPTLRARLGVLARDVADDCTGHGAAD